MTPLRRAQRRSLRLHARFAAAIGGCALLLAVSRAGAHPQVSVSGIVAGAAADLRSDHPHAALQLGAKADALFLRSRDADMGVGPYVDFVSTGLETLELGGGAEWLVPLSTTLPLIVSAGACERRAPGFEWEPAAVGTIFIGSHSYNFESIYSLTGGLFLQGRYGLGDARQADVILGAQFDLAVVVLPFVLAVNAFR